MIINLKKAIIIMIINLKKAIITMIIKRKTSKQPIHGEIKAICHSKKLYKLLNQENLCIFDDDETCCKKNFSQLLGKQYFYQSKGRYITRKFKYIQSEKFSPKFLVWQATCSCGLKSAPYIICKTLNSDLYMEEYL